jgi:hypothetical protein
MASDVKIWTGSAWQSIVGPQGPAGPTVVSADAGNVAKLGADGRISVQPADMDSRFVNVTGDTMTGVLIVQPAVGPAAPDGSIQVIGNGTNANLSLQRNDAAGQPSVRFKRSRGTTAAPTVVQSGDSMGSINFTGVRVEGNYVNAGGITVNCTGNPVAGDANIRSQMIFNLCDGTNAFTSLIIASNGVTTTNVTATNVTATSTVQATQVTATSGVTTPRLDVTSAAYLDGPMFQQATNGIAQVIEQTSPGATSQSTGLSVEIVPVASKTSKGIVVTNMGLGTDSNIGLEVISLPKGPNNYSFYDGSPADNFLRGNTGINWATPTANLEVSATVTQTALRVRGTMEVTGNITASGTAHAFAAGSIPTSALGGSFGALTATTVSATGGRSNFAPLSEPYAIGLRYNAAGLPNYIGTTATGEFQISSAGGVSLFRIEETNGNITSPGTAHSFVNASIPAAAIKDLPIATQVITQTAYNALAVKSPTTLYLISGV